MATKYAITPTGTLNYPYIVEPDFEFDANGVYHTKLELPLGEAEAIVEAIHKVRDTFIQEVKETKTKGKAPKEGPLPYETQDNGTVLFKFKLKASVKTATKEFTQKPVLRAPDGSELTVRPGNGSTAKIAYEIVPFYNPALGVGIQLRLRGVKVIELIELSRGGSNFFGDDNEEESSFEGNF